MNATYFISKFQSAEKKNMIKLIEAYEDIANKENCDTIFGFNNDCFCVVGKREIEIGNSRKSVRMHIENFMSIFDICKEMRQDIMSIGFTFNNLKMFPETTESAEQKKKHWLEDFAF